ncbi:HEAT repeat domain-containing protein [Armatimonas sp.]|uniref:HEAT repeat domain-containing protein n=1 Tax=Armatimonas sp. TaxID=1872638 RepID=UPI00286BE7D1|nr:HEAT repeat domain-containing protein [Armatimonas sp.]
MRLLTEVERFQRWADAYPVDQRSGEWETFYEDWNDLYDAVFDYVTNHPFIVWSVQNINLILYAIARDNALGYIAREILDRFPELILPLTRAAIASGEPDARWQLAMMLSLLSQETLEPRHLLLILVQDNNEYVRRKSLYCLAHLRAPEVEDLALEAWNRPDPAQEYARMMALSCLQQVHSLKLDTLLVEAERDERQYLQQYAQRMRKKMSI